MKNLSRNILKTKQNKVIAFLSLLALSLLILTPTISQVYAGTTSSAANKVAAAASTAAVACTGAACGTAIPTKILLLSGTIKTSTTIDLMISVSLECSLFTTVSVKGNSQSTATAAAVVYVQIDGHNVPVSDSSAFGGTSDNGQVVFCNRAVSLTTAQFTETELITLSINSTNANAFNWMAWNVGNEYPGTPAGSNTHTINVYASVTQTTTGGSSAVVIGARTMIAEPTSLANQISF